MEQFNGDKYFQTARLKDLSSFWFFKTIPSMISPCGKEFYSANLDTYIDLQDSSHIKSGLDRLIREYREAHENQTILFSGHYRKLGSLEDDILFLFNQWKQITDYETTLGMYMGLKPEVCYE